jgi:tetratricopeptide (TPR) repeat protein
MIDNFDQLLARCERAKQRRIIRLSFKIVGSILFVVAGISGYQMWLTSQAAPVAAETAAIVTKETTPQSSVPALNNQLKQTQNSVATPIAASITPVETKKVTITAPIPSASAVTAKSDSTISTAPATAVPVPAAAPTVKSDRLFEVNTQKADTPLEAYQNNPKYETALAVARDYYAKQNFTDAATWAKKANQMNREAEEAWLLYAKSYYAQGRKSEAIGVLELYLNYKDSKAASELMRTWKLNSTN